MRGRAGGPAASLAVTVCGVVHGRIPQQEAMLGSTSDRFHQPPPSAWNRSTVSGKRAACALTS